ncbi:enoyl-CoA hydratase/isomerase family protein [Rhodococcus sp. UNC23MFCrub1.1]|uniref:enoyl-CoA hydratase/isomerase family protein n=1 Tax=Rhodococcus sp. UNC23MFCrub1.1 TaxID=1449068 RepID=UPI000485513F|nr:enoyl-CoA hydratase/isomerase family protein [Rhodococcus sp. UNC23MFCrub1.1]
MSKNFETNSRAAGHILEIVLDRPDRGNSLSATTFWELAEVLHTAETDDSITALIVRGNHGTFCLGGDMSDPAGKRDPRYADAIHHFTEQWLNRTIPAVALVDGGAQAYGCALALSSDLVYTTDRAWFALPELHHGLVPAYALAVLNATGNAAVGARLMWQGERLSPDEVARTVSRVIPCNTLQVAENTMEARIENWIGGGMDSLRRARRFINKTTTATTESNLESAREELQTTLHAVEDDAREAQSYLVTENDFPEQ